MLVSVRHHKFMEDRCAYKSIQIIYKFSGRKNWFTKRKHLTYSFCWIYIRYDTVPGWMGWIYTVKSLFPLRLQDDCPAKKKHLFDIRIDKCTPQTSNTLSIYCIYVQVQLNWTEEDHRKLPSTQNFLCTIKLKGKEKTNANEKIEPEQSSISFINIIMFSLYYIMRRVVLKTNILWVAVILFVGALVEHVMCVAVCVPLDLFVCACGCVCALCSIYSTHYIYCLIFS